MMNVKIHWTRHAHRVFYDDTEIGIVQSRTTPGQWPHGPARDWRALDQSGAIVVEGCPTAIDAANAICMDYRTQMEIPCAN